MSGDSEQEAAAWAATVHPVYREIGRRVRDARRGAGLTQNDLAERIGISRTGITNLERGRQAAGLGTLYELAAALGVGPGELLPKDLEPTDRPMLPAGYVLVPGSLLSNLAGRSHALAYDLDRFSRRVSRIAEAPDGVESDVIGNETINEPLKGA